MLRPIDLIFTRDFGLFTAEFWRDQLMSQDLKEVCGLGISEQITLYNSEVEKYFRLRQEVKRLKKHIISLKLDHSLFSLTSQVIFRSRVDTLRKIIKVEPKSAQAQLQTFRESLLLMSQLYPWYMMSIFVAGPWSDDFSKFHGIKALKVIKRQYSDRVYSEGLLKEFSLFIRSLLAKQLKSLKINPIYSNVIRYEEGLNLMENKKYPAVKVLKVRLKGYISTKDRFISGNFSFAKLEKLGYKYDSPKVINDKITGVVAYKADRVRGRVRVVLTAKDVINFSKSGILVTPMTAPDFLPAMRLASAIITDEGGVTCHAAIVARELKKPCIIGTKVATKVLKDGDLVEVDTNKSTVIKIK